MALAPFFGVRIGIIFGINAFKHNNTQTDDNNGEDDEEEEDEDDEGDVEEEEEDDEDNTDNNGDADYAELTKVGEDRRLVHPVRLLRCAFGVCESCFQNGPKVHPLTSSEVNNNDDEEDDDASDDGNGNSRDEGSAGFYCLLACVFLLLGLEVAQLGARNTSKHPRAQSLRPSGLRI